MCNHGVMTYDTSKLARLGKEHRKRRAALDQLRTELAAEIIAAHEADVPQKDIVEMTGYTREAVRQLCLSPEQKEEENRKRRERTRKNP